MRIRRSVEKANSYLAQEEITIAFLLLLGNTERKGQASLRWHFGFYGYHQCDIHDVRNGRTPKAKTNKLEKSERTFRAGRKRQLRGALLLVSKNKN
ncbi:hypothetical protein NPIL_229241 [Nephila pilipes]|uniref:Uncharacterized protein n=1 Tax=Nephila pilipes TaxID=299642 RepID=A0A8X6R1F7_NEPPI|nr:hypothetical protein NPIL_229241 [Nephila pilipes]